MKYCFRSKLVSLIVAAACGHSAFASAHDIAPAAPTATVRHVGNETLREDRSTVVATAADSSARLAGPHMHTRLSAVPLVFALTACGSGGSLAGGGNPPPGTVEVSPAASTASVTVPISGSLPEVTMYAMNAGSTPIPLTCTTDVPWLVVTSFAPGVLLPTESRACHAALVGPQVSLLGAGVHTGQVLFESGGLTVGTHTLTLTVSLAATGTPMTTASRTSGVAPLSVVFDAIGSATGVAQPAGTIPDYGSFTYEWSYGDPGSGNWNHTGRSRNSSLGWIGAHVFEQPGTYRVGLKVTNHQGTEFNYHQDITVTNPETVFASSTYYVAANGNDANPGTLSQPFRTFDRGMAATFGSNGPARLLLRRGDSFTTPTEFYMGTKTGPYLIAAFGSGARPSVVTTANGGALFAKAVTDLRVADIAFTMNAPSPLNYAFGVMCGPQTTLVRCSLSGYGNTLPIERHDNVIVDCDILNSMSYGVYANVPDDNMAVHMAILGCRLDGSGMHLLRFSMSRALVGENLFQSTGVTAVKQNGRTMPSPQRHTCVVGNIFETTVGWVHVIGPQNQTSDEHSVDSLIEGNLYRPSSASGTAAVLLVFGERITVRNNVFDLAGDSYAFGVRQQGIGPHPTRVVFEHNTLYRRTGSPLHTMTIDSADSTIVRNNIFFCATGSVNQPTGTLTASANLTANPMLADPSNRDYSLLGGSPAIDTAVGTSTRTDYRRSSRAHGVAADAGAVERTN
jgi:hypothetical protein